VGRGKRGKKDGTGPYWDSYERRSGKGGKKDQCYKKKKN